MSEKLKKLQHKRSTIETQLNLFVKFLDSVHESVNEITLKNLQNRLNNIELLLENFGEIQSEIELLDPDEDKNITDRETFQNTFFDATSKTQVIIDKFNNKQVEQNIECENCSQSIVSNASQGQLRRINNVKLPRIDLPTFDGTFTLWREFSDHFTAMVHNNYELSNCQKLCYLRATLKGEPANMLRALDTTDSNYNIAWDALCKRYNNKRKIINNHVNAILNLNDISKDSHIKIREFIDNLQTHMQCLKSFDQQIEFWDSIIIPIVLTKLDLKTVQEWETQLNSELSNDEMPNYDSFINFLNKRQNTLEAIISRKAPYVEFKYETKPKYVKVHSTFNITCPNCNGTHLLQSCELFLKLTPSERFNKVKSLKLCTNCLRKGHFVSECKSTMCKICHKKHHTALHLNIDTKKDVKINANSQSQISDIENNTESKNTTTSCSVVQNQNETLLSTAKINVLNSKGQTITLTCLLDSASQSNFISEYACTLLNLKLCPTEMAIVGINQKTSNLNYQTNVTISSKYNYFKTKINCFVLPKVVSVLPHSTITRSKFEIPPNIKLADPNFNESKTIDMLIGASLFWNLLCIGQIKNSNGTVLQKTKLGWIISGQLNIADYSSTQKTITCLTLNDLNEQLQNFWKIDEFSSKKTFLTPDEEYCETVFKQTTTRAPDGKFIVKIPIKPNIDDLGNSYEVAKNRFIILEKRFEKNYNLKNDYANCINDYLIQNHASKTSEVKNSFFLPHHAVIKETRDTTKLRVVFDGSCNLNSGLSINQLQYVGPTIQNDLFSIITRFRSHKYVITGDITQMYRQVWVHPTDRKYQKIIWRDNPLEPLEYLELNTLTFGMKSAPFLAIRCLFKLAELNNNSYPIECKIIRNDFYVDDLLTGTNSVEHLKTLQQNIIDILKQGGFILRKFKSNVDELNEDKTTNELKSLSNCTNKALGVFWNPNTDNFSFSISDYDYNNTEVTKRTILSCTAKLFDPIGMLAPIIIIAKIIIQEIWQLNLNWDETVPSDIHSKWLIFQKELKFVNNISIPRFILVSNATIIEMHGFADASEKAYGACIYIKSINHNNETLIRLLAAKSRVAPLKNLSLPKLELLAAVLLTELANKFKNILNLNIDKEYWWSDSKIVLSWLKSHPSKWTTFVANRVSLIQNLCNVSDWHHVKSHDNPADIISRGMLPYLLIHSKLWWEGPTWLIDNNFINTISNDHDNQLLNVAEIPELKKITKVFSIIEDESTNIISNYSNLNKLKRVVAWCLRFADNCRVPIEKRKFDQLDINEINLSLIKLVKIVQIESFCNDYAELIKQKQVNAKSTLLSLCPFLDENGLIRVGGRLQNSDFSFDKRHPILLPKNHHFTKLIFINEHLRLSHAGPTLLLSNIREKFWPISGRNLAKQTVKLCVKCFRFNSKNINPIMGDLPNARVNPMPPFHTVGIDYAGPIFIKDRLGRNPKKIKCYISVFICFTTKAIHLEPITSLTTNAFIAALRRFVSRRGKPLHIYSDNGTNFQGANAELSKLYDWMKTEQNNIVDKACSEGINWHFIPPHSPHFGGLWEAGVKSTKHHLKRVLSDASLTFEDLYTVLVQIECILNSRPLTPMTTDPNDLHALTPAHFLIGRTHTSLIDPDVQDIKLSRLDRYQYLQKINQHFWNRWSKEYISQLHQRYKWNKNQPNFKIDSLVLVKEDNLPPCSWKLGRIIELHPGKDGVVRVASVKCNSGVIKRPIVKLSMLPTNNDDNQ